MMRPVWIPLLFFAVCALSVPAALPGDAAFRTQEIYTYRQMKMEEFKRAREQHGEEMVARVREARIELAAPPWNGPSAISSGTAGGLQRSAPEKTDSGRQSRTRIGTIMALLFLAGCVWWVQILTDGQQGE